MITDSENEVIILRIFFKRATFLSILQGLCNIIYLFSALTDNKVAETRILYVYRNVCVCVCEVRDILKGRDQEESAITPKISIYDMARNEKARLHVEKQVKCIIRLTNDFCTKDHTNVHKLLKYFNNT